jgi:hypothetical protein
MATVEDIYYIVNQAIDLAFMQEKYQLNFFDYLKGENFKKDVVDTFLNSSLKVCIDHQIEELDMYILGGPTANDLREAYSWMGKPRARKVKEYLEKILKDASDYERTKRRGRKPKTSNK